MFRRNLITTGILAGLVGFGAPALAQQSSPATAELTRDNAIAGQIVVDFNSLRPNAADELDHYTIDLNVADYVSFEGQATRDPDTSIEYNVKLLAHNPKNPSQTKHVAQLKGIVAIDSTGKYLLRGTDKVRIDPSQRLMISMLVTPKGMNQDNPFDGTIQGKLPKAKGLLARLKQTVQTVKEQVKEYTRTIGGKTVKVSVKNPDVMEFQNLKLGAGPWPELTEVTVNGNLDYDYASGNWITNGISMSYTQAGQPAEDTITGTIRWTDEEGSLAVGGEDRPYTGYYDFNLRFNESDFNVGAEEAFFSDSTSEEDVFFATDDRVPALLGRVYFNDSEFVGEGEEETASHSDVIYALNANKLTPVQLVNFTKLWLLAIGPVHDD